MRSGNTARIYALDGEGINPIHGSVNCGRNNKDWIQFSWKADGNAQNHDGGTETEWDLVEELTD